MPRYVPDAGDLVWISFDPQTGREQAGRRPGLVLSPRLYNLNAGLALVCPITTKTKGYRFDVALPEESAIRGVVLADHVRSLDWRMREAEPAGRVPAEVLDEVCARLAPLLGY